MELQFIVDSKGKSIAVIIPIDEWNAIIDKYEDLKDLIDKNDNAD